MNYGCYTPDCIISGKYLGNPLNYGAFASLRKEDRFKSRKFPGNFYFFTAENFNISFYCLFLHTILNRFVFHFGKKCKPASHADLAVCAEMSKQLRGGVGKENHDMIKGVYLALCS